MNQSILQSMDILIVETHQMFIDGIKLLLKNTQGVSHIYEAKNGKAALDIIKEQKIDILITDLNMPEMSGLELTRLIKAKYPLIKVIVLTMYNDRGIIKEIINSKADGYILKNTDQLELVKAINEIAAGGIYFSSQTNRIIIED